MNDLGQRECNANTATEAAQQAKLTDAARRALAEAAKRRARADADNSGQSGEVDGRGGPDPVRYGDWENKGIASDF